MGQGGMHGFQVHESQEAERFVSDDVTLTVALEPYSLRITNLLGIESPPITVCETILDRS